jgi:PKD repeat protein
MRHSILATAVVLSAVVLSGIITDGPVQAAGTVKIYATSAGQGEASFYSVNPDTGLATKIGNVGFYRISAMDFDDSGVLYGVCENVDGDSVLITINTTTGAGTLVGATGIVDEVPGCTYDEENDKFYAFGEDGDLYEVDLTDGDATLIGYDANAEMAIGNAIGFDSAGVLYHCLGEELWTVDASDGSHTYDADLSVDTGDTSDYIDGIRSMDWDEGASAFKAILKLWDDSEGAILYKLVDLDPTDGSLDIIGDTENLGSIAVIEDNTAPEITSGPTATPTKVSLASGSVDFAVTATDADGDQLTYAWDFGDGSSATGATPTHVYSTSGNFTATVTVSDGSDEATAAVGVTVNSPPSFSLVPSATPPTVSPASPTVNFAASAIDPDGDPMTWLWDFGDGNTATTATASHTYAAEGTYTVGVTVSDGLDQTTWTGSVLVNTPPVIDTAPTAFPTKVSLQSGNVQFTVAASDANGHPLTLTWDFGDGASDTGDLVSHTYTASGDYTATVTVDDGTDSVMASIDITVNTPPVIDTPPTASPALVEIGETVTFGGGATDANGDPVTYAWEFGDGSNGTGLPATHAFTAAGDYTATLTATDGQDPTSATVDLVVAKSIDIGKVTGKLNFKKASKDALVLKGEIALPGTFAAAGKELRVDFGGLVTVFQLDAKGKAKNDAGKARLKFKKKTGLWTYQVALKKGDFAAAWADEGLTDETVSGKAVSVKTILTVDGVPFIRTASFTYKGKAGKSGKLK